MQEWFSRIPSLELLAPYWLLLLPMLGLMLWLRSKLDRQGKNLTLMFPCLGTVRNLGLEANKMFSHLPQWLRWSALLLCVFALTGPRVFIHQTEAEVRGLDVMLALDISESMLQKDNVVNSRLYAATNVARSFVLRRSNDQIGLVVFRGKAYTQCPLTTDHEVLAMLLDHIFSPRLILQDDGTAIGSAILIAINRLKASSSLNKVIILITDGENNTGEIWPTTAASIAVQNGIRIYVVNVGFKTVRRGKDFSGERDRRAAIDEESLREVARITSGGYFIAEDPSALDKAIKSISRLETNLRVLPVIKYHSELFPFLLLLSILLLFIEIALSNTRLLRVP
ncbi:MAG: VWA domain-containing protein [Chlorobiaceae bacterium]